MKNFKRLSIFVILVGTLFLFTGCGSKNVDGKLEDIMTKLYKGIPEDEVPGALTNIPLTDENIEGFLGTKDIEYEEALASESMIGSFAYSVVMVRTKDGVDVEKTKETIEKAIIDNTIYRKWICVEVPTEDIIIENKGNLILVLLVQDENARTKLEKNFKNL